MLQYAKLTGNVQVYYTHKIIEIEVAYANVIQRQYLLDKILIYSVSLFSVGFQFERFRTSEQYQLYSFPTILVLLRKLYIFIPP